MQPDDNVVDVTKQNNDKHACDIHCNDVIHSSFVLLLLAVAVVAIAVDDDAIITLTNCVQLATAQLHAKMIALHMCVHTCHALMQHKELIKNACIALCLLNHKQIQRSSLCALCTALHSFLTGCRVSQSNMGFFIELRGPGKENSLSTFPANFTRSLMCQFHHNDDMLNINFDASAAPAICSSMTMVSSTSL